MKLKHIPNILSVIRILLVGVFVYTMFFVNAYVAMVVFLIAGATDVIDGYLARRNNWITDLGKILDPVADKLTQTALLFCLLTKHPLMLGLIVVFGVCELTKLALGAVVMKKHDEVNSAKWYGKLNTIVIYGVMILLIMFPNMNVAWANTLIVGCGIVMIVAHILYAQFYYFILRKSKVSKGNKKE